MSTIFLNADRSAIVPAGSAEAAFGVQPKDMKRLGYDGLPLRGGATLPDDLPEPETLAAFELRSASLLPEPPEAKEAPKPDDKAAAKPSDKSVKKAETK